MRSFHFQPEYLKLLTPETVSLLTFIHEKKGQQDLLVEAQPDILRDLLEVARVQSTEASNRIEGIVTTEDRLRKILRDKTTPKGRSECEIAGYRDVLATIHESYDYIPVRPGMILQLHRDLYKFSGSSAGGTFKTADNVIAETCPDGTRRVRFEPVPAWETPEAVDALCGAFAEALKDEEMDPLLLIPMFVLDYLCIHPFNDGNGRMSRLLTLLLLDRAGYIVGKYISIERLIADSRESCYEALRASSAGWHEEKNTYLPFVGYLLGVIAAAYREFSERADVLAAGKLSRTERIGEVFRRTPGKLTKADVMERCPDISRKTVERALKELTDNGSILKIGGGRYTSYIWDRETDEVAAHEADHK